MAVCRFGEVFPETNTHKQNNKKMQKITPFLWFDNQAEEAVKFYTSIFKNSRIVTVTRYGEAGPGPKGSVMVVGFELEGQRFTALNGGPHFKFTEAISFVVRCETQAEIDHYWDKLCEGGDEKAQQCGWLKDKFGRLVANRSRRLVRDDGRSPQRKIRTRHASHAANEEIEPGSTASSLCRDLIRNRIFESTGTLLQGSVFGGRGVTGIGGRPGS